MKAKLSIIAGFLVGAVLLYFAFRNVDFRALAGIYSRINPAYILPFSGVVLLEMLLRSARWRLLLNPSAPVRLWDAFRLQAAGLALNNVLPMRLGEIARATFGAGLFKIPVLTVLATILVERALDTLVLFLLFAVAAYAGGIGGNFMKYDQFLWVAFAGLIAAMLALVFADEIVAHHWFAGFFARFPRVRAAFERLAMGVKGFHSPGRAALIFLFAAGQWLLDVVNYYLMAVAFGLDGTLNFLKCTALLFSGALAASVPGMPGYFGNFEYALTRVMYSWGIPKDIGFAYASYLHVLAYLAITIVGVFFVYQMGQSLGQVWREFAGGEKAA